MIVSQPVIVGLTAHTEEIARLGQRFAAAGKSSSAGYSAALNRVGQQTTTAMVRALTAQTGLKRKVIVTALRKKGASPGSLRFMIESSGGDISLKYFSPRETRAGVTAAPFGHRQLFPGTFMKGGRFPNRKTARGLNGHVWKRVGSTRKPLEMQKSGVIIPREMVKGASEAAFYSTVEANLPARLLHELTRRLAAI